MAEHAQPHPVMVEAPAGALPHYIEERVGAYLRLSADGDRWAIDGATMDRAGLEGYDNGPVNEECQCSDEAVCDEALAASEKLGCPTPTS